MPSKPPSLVLSWVAVLGRTPLRVSHPQLARDGISLEEASVVLRSAIDCVVRAGDRSKLSRKVVNSCSRTVSPPGSTLYSQRKMACSADRHYRKQPYSLRSRLPAALDYASYTALPS
jgi:hypothetical protein